MGLSVGHVSSYSGYRLWKRWRLTTSIESCCRGYRNLATQAEEGEYVLNCFGQGRIGMLLLSTCCIRSASLDLDVEVF
jgi:hypothetical protein